MFLQQYLNKLIDYNELDSLARLWPNFETDYKPLVDYARNNSIKFVSTNIPRRYASLVYTNGFSALENLTKTEKEWISPLPIKYDSNLPGYKKMINMIPDHANVNFPKAQAIKDATMAYFILQIIPKISYFCMLMEVTIPIGMGIPLMVFFGILKMKLLHLNI